jgi:hypothetical protein
MRYGRGKVRILRVLGVLHKRRVGVHVFRMIGDDTVSTAYYISKYKNLRQKVILLIFAKVTMETMVCVSCK